MGGRGGSEWEVGMEKMGSSSVPASVACGASDSLHGLKFGQKIYFEDVCGGGSFSKASGEGSAPAPKRGKGVLQGGQQPPRCQVEGCNVDLSDAKAYYSRHKVCGMHSKSPKVVVGGLEQRFCQQCSRFHLLPEFDQGKRSCRRRLAGHNERRRKPPPGPLSTRYGRLSSSFYDSSRFRGFLMDFSYPTLQGAPRERWPTVGAGDRVMSNQWHGGLNSPPNEISSFGGRQYMQGPSNGALFSAQAIPQGGCLAGVSSDSSCALSLLSTQQPWGSATSTRTLAPSISTSSRFDGGPMAQSVISSNYGNNAWSFKGNETGSSSHGDQHGMGLVQVNQCQSSQFPGELELALQGNRQCINLHNGCAYDHSDEVIHWSL